MAPAGPGQAAVARACGTVVAAGRDDERPERERPAAGSRERAVRERRERLDDTDERDPRRIVRVAVGVRVDGRLEAGEHLVGAGVDGDAAVRVGLPAGDPDRQQRRAGSDAVEPGGPADSDDETREPGPVPLGPSRLGRVRLGRRVAVRVEDVDPVQQPALEVRVAQVDARVELRDGHAGAVEAGDLQADPTAAGCPERLAVERRARQRGGVRGAHGVDARDRGVALDRREKRRVDRAGEAVEHPDEGLLGVDGRAARPEAGDRPPLRRSRGGRPGPHLPLGRGSSGPADAVGERRRAQHDDPPAAELRHRPAAEQPLPARRADGRPVGGPGRAAEREDARSPRARRARLYTDA